MYRGTTPTLTLTLPFQTSLIQHLYITFEQKGSIVLEKTEKDCVLSAATIILNLSQADTLKFAAAKRLNMQVRILDNSNQALASQIYTIKVNEILHDGEIAAKTAD